MKFSWMKFDTKFLLEVISASEMSDDFKKSAVECSDDKERLVSKMNRIAPEPTRDFIKQYRVIIEQDCLKLYKGTTNRVFKAVNVTGTSYNDKLIKLARKTLSAPMIQAYVAALYEIAGLDVEISEYSKFSSTVSINMQQTEIEEVPLYDFQKKAIKELRDYFITKDQKAGICVMPTGSGKSRTAIHFLIQDMIGRGYQILWIAHRHMLLDQAADNFYRMSGLAKTHNPNMKEYRISCISGEHLSIRQVDKHEVIIASIASICRSKDHLKRILGNKVMVVVDEAHHTVAPSYDDVIKFIQKTKKNVKLLGLTATPIRGNDRDTSYLLNMYHNTYIYNISMSDLIAKGILANPEFKKVKTGEYFEPVITKEEANKIKRMGELPPSVISKIADSKSRNEVILKEYLKHKKEYGKTLIFALNVVHCQLLYKELKRHKINCNLVYSGKEDNKKVIQDFKEGKYDVLVNVNIMTEGTDVPDINTIFLTRPTTSEALLMQMIGRGMRGPFADGTEKVTIVDFNDQWSVFNKWLDPEWMILGEIGEAPEKEDKNIQYTYTQYDWNICQQVYKAFQTQLSTMEVSLSIPVGWYTLIDGEGELRRMLIFENQVEGMNRLIRDREYWEVNSLSGIEAINRYFPGFDFAPASYEIELFMENVLSFGKEPARHELENRKEIDPYYVAKKAEELGVDIFQYAAKMYDENTIARDLFADKDGYILDVCKAKIYDGKKTPLGIKVEEMPVELFSFDPTPCYDLDKLVQKVKDKMFDGTFDGIDSISWTDKPYRIYYGLHTKTSEGEHHIKINSLLNSPSVNEEVVMFVIYHELLHRDNMSHDKAFREEEHKYPNYAEWEYFLEGHMAEFEIQDW